MPKRERDTRKPTTAVDEDKAAQALRLVHTYKPELERACRDLKMPKRERDTRKPTTAVDEDKAAQALRLVHTYKPELERACRDLKMPKWSLDDANGLVMERPVVLPKCGHIVDRAHFSREVLAGSGPGAGVTCLCPVSTCQQLLDEPPHKMRTNRKLKKEIEREHEFRQRRFSSEHQLVYDQIRAVVSRAFARVTKDTLQQEI